MLKNYLVWSFTVGLLLLYSHVCYAWPSQLRQSTPYLVYGDGKEIKMSIEANQLRTLIKEVLTHLGHYSEDAVELLMLTAAVESHCGSYIEQVGGPARGIFQMEPATEQDIWDNYLVYNGDLESAVLQIMLMSENRAYRDWDLRANLVYQIVMARIHYLRVPERLPDSDDINAMARYWKQYYNTPKGRGVPEKAIRKYKIYAKK